MGLENNNILVPNYSTIPIYSHLFPSIPMKSGVHVLYCAVCVNIGSACPLPFPSSSNSCRTSTQPQAPGAGCVLGKRLGRDGAAATQWRAQQGGLGYVHRRDVSAAWSRHSKVPTIS